MDRLLTLFLTRHHSVHPSILSLFVTPHYSPHPNSLFTSCLSPHLSPIILLLTIYQDIQLLTPAHTTRHHLPHSPFIVTDVHQLTYIKFSYIPSPAYHTILLLFHNLSYSLSQNDQWIMTCYIPMIFLTMCHFKYAVHYSNIMYQFSFVSITRLIMFMK